MAHEATVRAMKAEIERRSGRTDAVMALFRSKPGIWIPWTDLQDVGGSCAWRSRVAEARKRFKKEGATIEWNRQLSSAYRYLPYEPLGRSADVKPGAQAALF